MIGQAISILLRNTVILVDEISPSQDSRGFTSICLAAASASPLLILELSVALCFRSMQHLLKKTPWTEALPVKNLLKRFLCHK